MPDSKKKYPKIPDDDHGKEKVVKAVDEESYSPEGETPAEEKQSISDLLDVGGPAGEVKE